MRQIQAFVFCLFLSASTDFSQFPPLFASYSLPSFSSSSLCRSVLCGVSTMVITLLTDAGLWAMQHLTVSASLFVLSDVHIRSPYYSTRSQSLILENSTMQGWRLGTFHLFLVIRSIQGDALLLNLSISCRLFIMDTL